MPRKGAGGAAGKRRWGWGALMGTAFLAGLLLVGIALIRAPDAEKPRRETAAPAAGSPVAPGNPAPGTPPRVEVSVPTGGPRIAIVVDDLGYNPVRDAEWLDFPVPFTVAVLPFGPSSKSVAASARKRGRTVLLHVPMEPEGSVSDRTEPYLLRRGMPPEEIMERFAKMASDVPQAVGASNHMGSAFTSDPEAMAAFANALKGKNFFFLDSMTSGGSVGAASGAREGVPVLRRDILLDGVANPDEIRVQWRRAVAVAKERGEAIVLCHARAETRKALGELLPELPKEGVRVVPLEEMLPAVSNRSR